MMTQSIILEDILQNCKKATLGHEIFVISLYFLKYMNLQTQFPSDFFCVIIHHNIDMGIEYIHQKVLNFDIFCRDNKS